MKNFIGLLLLLCCGALVMANMDTPESVPAKDLVDMKICWWGKVCMFTADVNLKLEERADTAAGSVKDSTARFDLAIDFNVTSQRGSKKHEFYRVDITQFYGGANSSITEEIQRFPFFFSQRRDTGIVEQVYISTREKKALSRFKAGLVRSLLRRVHKKALKNAGHSEDMVQPTNMTYLYEGNDVSGPFITQHEITHESTTGNLVLLEETFFKRKNAFAQNTKSKTKTISMGDQNLSIKQKRSSKAVLSADGRVNRLSTKETLSIGTAKAIPSNNGKDSKITNPVPSFGRSIFSVAFDVHRIESQNISLSRKPKNEQEIQEDIETMLGGASTIATTGSSNFLEFGSGDDDDSDEDQAAQVDPATALLQAETLLSKGTFTVKDLAPLVRAGGAKPLLAHAWGLYDDGTLGIEGMKTVLGALAAKRSPETYDALLSALKDDSLPEDLRQQAAVSLLHTSTENGAPDYVVRSVSQLAYRPHATMSPEATLLLGSLLSGRSEEDTEMQLHMSKLKRELKALDPENVQTADRAVALLGALSNSDASDATASVLKFLDSPVTSVRVAAVDALRSLRNAERARNAALNNSEEEIEHDDDDDINNNKVSEIDSKEWNDEDDEDDDDDVSVSFLDLGAGDSRSREMVNEQWTLAGNADVDLSAKAKCGVKYSNGKTGGYGDTDIKVRVLDFTESVLSTGFQGHVSAGSSASAPGTGDINLRLDVAGKRILSRKWELDNADIIKGGVCPENTLDSRVTARDPNIFSREIFRFKRRFLIGPVPIKVNVALTGSVGYRMYYNAFLNCKSAKSPSDLAFVGGIAPFADLIIESDSVADVFVASAGAKSNIHVLRGEVPTYAATTTSVGCAAVDINSQSATGVVDIFTKAVKKQWEKRLVNWLGKPLKQTLFKKCDMMSIGNFLAGRALPAPSAKPTTFFQEQPSYYQLGESVAALNNPYNNMVNAAPMPPHVMATPSLPLQQQQPEEPATIASVVNIAKQQLGICEASGNNDGVPSERYAHGRREPWCADFVAWCFHQAGQTLPGNQRSLAGVQYMENQLRAAGKLLSSSVSPAPGDIIFFTGKDGSLTSGRHAGIVTGVANGEIQTIEGNSGNCVRARSHKLNSRRISGFGRIDFRAPSNLATSDISMGYRMSLNQIQQQQEENYQNSFFAQQAYQNNLAAAQQAEIASQYASQASSQEQQAASSSSTMSSELSQASSNAGLIQRAEQSASTANQIGESALNQAGGLAAQAQQVEGNVASNTKQWNGVPRSAGTAQLSSELRDKLDGANGAAYGVGGQIVGDGQRTRDAVRGQGERSRDLTREEGTDDRKTERNAGNTLGAKISDDSQQTRDTVRNVGERGRDTVRSAAVSVAGDVSQQGSSERRAERRDSRREMQAEQGEKRTERREEQRLEGDMQMLQNKEGDASMRNMIRRNMDEVMQKDASLQGTMRREEERNRLRRVSEDEKRRVDGLKDKIYRDDQEKSQERGVDQLASETRRKFANEDEKSRFGQLDRQMNRDADTKDFERRQFDGVKGVMRRDEAKQAEQADLSRFENRVQRETDGAKQVQAAIGGVENKVSQDARSEENQMRRDTDKIEGQMQQQNEMKDIAADSQRTRKELRQDERRDTQNAEMNAIKGEVQKDNQQDKNLIRNLADKTSQQIQQDSSQQQQQQDFNKIADATRTEGQETRTAERDVSQNVDQSLDNAQQQQSFNQAMQGVDQAQNQAVQEQQQQGAQMDQNAQSAGSEMLGQAKDAAKELMGDMGQAAQQMGNQENQAAEKTARELNRNEKSRESFFKKAENSAKNHRKDIKNAIGKVKNGWDKMQKQTSNRMNRMANRDTRRREEDNEKMRRKTDRLDDNVKNQMKTDEHHMTRRLARRKERTDERMGSLSKDMNKRINKAERHEQDRLARRSGRRASRNQETRQHWQRRFARDSAREDAARQKMKKHFTERSGRQEARVAGEMDATNKRFGLRMGRSQQMFNALAK